MIIKKGQRKRIKCNVCKNVKDATLIHAKKSLRKTMTGKIITEIDTFILQYRIGKHAHGSRLCEGSNTVQSRHHDRMLNSSF